MSQARADLSWSLVEVATSSIHDCVDEALLGQAIVNNSATMGASFSICGVLMLRLKTAESILTG